MSVLRRRFGNPAWFPMRDWFDLNSNELAWIALVFCAVAFVGLVMT